MLGSFDFGDGLRLESRRAGILPHRRGCRRPRGAVAQLGERLNGIQEVVGSIPISSTNPLLPPFRKRLK